MSRPQKTETTVTVFCTMQTSQKFIAYYRVSTDRQGQSGLGLDAQRTAVLNHITANSELVAEFTEVESGKKNDRPQLAAALASCKKQKAKLIIAKLDRLARNVAFIANLMESGVEFIAVDNPHANKLMLHMLAALLSTNGNRSANAPKKPSPLPKIEAPS